MSLENKIKDIGTIKLSTKKSDDNFFSSSKIINELTSKDFDSIKTFILKNPNHDCILIMFYAPWCPYCINAKDLWNKIGNYITFTEVSSFNCEKNKSCLNRMNVDFQKEAKNTLVSSYPTIWLYKKGKPFKKFEQERTFENIIEFCKKNC